MADEEQDAAIENKRIKKFTMTNQQQIYTSDFIHPIVIFSYVQVHAFA